MIKTHTLNIASKRRTTSGAITRTSVLLAARFHPVIQYIYITLSIVQSISRDGDAGRAEKFLLRGTLTVIVTMIRGENAQPDAFDS